MPAARQRCVLLKSPRPGIRSHRLPSPTPGRGRCSRARFSFAPASRPAGKEQRREDAGRQALEADRLVELFLCMLAGQGVAEDLRQEPHPLEQLLRPRALAPDAAEAEAAVQLTGDDHRHRHVDFSPMRSQFARSKLASGGRSSRDANTTGRFVLISDHAQGQSSRVDLSSGALHPADGIGVRQFDPSGCGRHPVQRAPVDIGGFDDATQTVVDGLVDRPAGGLMNPADRSSRSRSNRDSSSTDGHAGTRSVRVSWSIIGAERMGARTGAKKVYPSPRRFNGTTMRGNLHAAYLACALIRGRSQPSRPRGRMRRTRPGTRQDSLGLRR